VQKENLLFRASGGDLHPLPPHVTLRTTPPKQSRHTVSPALTGSVTRVTCPSRTRLARHGRLRWQCVDRILPRRPGTWGRMPPGTHPQRSASLYSTPWRGGSSDLMAIPPPKLLPFERADEKGARDPPHSSRALSSSLPPQLTTGLSSEYSRAPESTAAPSSRRVDADKSLFAKCVKERRDGKGRRAIPTRPSVFFSITRPWRPRSFLSPSLSTPPSFSRYYVNQILQLGEEGIASAWSRVRVGEERGDEVRETPFFSLQQARSPPSSTLIISLFRPSPPGATMRRTPAWSTCPGGCGT